MRKEMYVMKVKIHRAELPSSLRGSYNKVPFNPLIKKPTLFWVLCISILPPISLFHQILLIEFYPLNATDAGDIVVFGVPV